MANVVTVKVTGLDDVKKSLAALVPEIQKKILNQTVRAGVVDWQKTAQTKAPMYHTVHIVGRKEKAFVATPGNLKRSIVVRKQRSTNPHESVYGVVVRKRAFYWMWVEFGSVNNTRKPFLRPTFDERSVPVVNNMAADFRKFIERYFRGRVRKLVKSLS